MAVLSLLSWLVLLVAAAGVVGVVRMLTRGRRADMAGRTALVTGGTCGLGLEFAKLVS